METKQTFRIPDANLVPLQQKIAQLSKKAMKLMGQPIVLKVETSFDVEDPKVKGGLHRFHVVSVEGPQPKVAGWKFCAAMDVVEADGNKMVVIRSAPGEVIPEDLRNHVKGCDHCNVDRNRKTLYVLRKDAP